MNIQTFKIKAQVKHYLLVIKYANLHEPIIYLQQIIKIIAQKPATRLQTTKC